jgi:hypothetical protein
LEQILQGNFKNYFPKAIMLADKGYLGKSLKNSLKTVGINLSRKLKKNTRKEDLSLGEKLLLKKKRINRIYPKPLKKPL